MISLLRSRLRLTLVLIRRSQVSDFEKWKSTNLFKRHVRQREFASIVRALLTASERKHVMPFELCVPLGFDRSRYVESDWAD